MQTLSPVDGQSGRVLTSPLVKRIAREEGVDLRAIQGTGLGGRVTRGDILDYVEHKKQGVVTPESRAIVINGKFDLLLDSVAEVMKTPEGPNDADPDKS